MKAKHRVNFDQCEYGSNANGSGLNKKATTVASNKPSMCRLRRPCAGKHTHVRLHGGASSRDAENYPELARAIAVLMAAPEGFETLDDVFPVDDDWDMTSPDHEADGPEAVDEVPPGDATVQGDEVWTRDGFLERMATL